MDIIQTDRNASSFLTSLYSEYRNLMLSIAHSYIDDAQVCEDVFHNAFISLIRNQKRLQELPRPKQKAYILLAIRHACFDYLRKERKMNMMDMPDDVLMGLISTSREQQVMSETPFKAVELYSVIQKMSVEDQTLLIGHYIIGLDSNELAQILDCSSGAVRVRLHRANKRALALFSSLGLSMEDFLI